MPPLSANLAVVLGYMIGSIPSAYLIGRLNGVDLTLENGDSRLGTSLSFHRLGLLGGLAVGFMDFSKGIAAIVVAQLLDAPQYLVLLSGLAAVVGHDWSIFLSLKGGRGTMTSYGVLASLMLWEFFIALALAGVFFLFVRKPTLATVVLLTIQPVILRLQSLLHFLPALPWESEFTLALTIFPLALLIPSFLKYAQTRRGGRLFEARPSSPH